MTGTRLPARPGEVIDRAAPLEFIWNGRTVTGYAGDTVVSALAASGCRVFSRSMKYHRPRGVMTADYWDPNTLLQVGNEPNVRGGHRPAEEGMQVSAQNAWPSLRFDLKALTGLGGSRPQRRLLLQDVHAAPVAVAVLREGAGTLRPRRRHRPRQRSPRRHEKRYSPPGRGRSRVVGRRAWRQLPTAAARAGARVLLVEHEHAIGGHLRWSGEASGAPWPSSWPTAARAAGVEILTDATVAGRWEDNWLSIVERARGGRPRVPRQGTGQDPRRGGGT